MAYRQEDYAWNESLREGKGEKRPPTYIATAEEALDHVSTVIN